MAQATHEFLEFYCEESLVGNDFISIIQQGNGETRFLNLLTATGFKENPEGFFGELLKQFENAKADNYISFSLNGIGIPYLMLLHLLEIILPGHNLVSIREVKQLENITNITVPEKERKKLQEVIETYPVRLSLHTIRQMMLSKYVSYQPEGFTPYAREHWIGQFQQGLLEQMYENRVIFLLAMNCPVYCRFCFRKHKESRNEVNPTVEDVKSAISHVEMSSNIKEILITGGDPFLNKANLECAIDRLMDIPHVQTLRLATRSIAYYPHLFVRQDRYWLNYLKKKNIELQQKGKSLEIATHFIHPDEITPISLDIVSVDNTVI